MKKTLSIMLVLAFLLVPSLVVAAPPDKEPHEWIQDPREFMSLMVSEYDQEAAFAWLTDQVSNSDQRYRGQFGALALRVKRMRVEPKTIVNRTPGEVGLAVARPDYNNMYKIYQRQGKSKSDIREMWLDEFADILKTPKLDVFYIDRDNNRIAVWIAHKKLLFIQARDDAEMKYLMENRNCLREPVRVTSETAAIPEDRIKPWNRREFEWKKVPVAEIIFRPF